MTSQCIMWHHTTQEIASHKMKTHQITSHDMTWRLATNHIHSPTTKCRISPGNQPHQNRSATHHNHGTVWASQSLVTLCTFYRQIFSLTYSFFSLKLPPPACPALLVNYDKLQKQRRWLPYSNGDLERFHLEEGGFGTKWEKHYPFPTFLLNTVEHPPHTSRSSKICVNAKMWVPLKYVA